MHPRRLFGEICMELDLITRPQVDRALEIQENLKRDGQSHKLIGLIMHEEQMLSNEQLILAIKEMDTRNKLSNE